MEVPKQSMNLLVTIIVIAVLAIIIAFFIGIFNPGKIFDAIKFLYSTFIAAVLLNLAFLIKAF